MKKALLLVSVLFISVISTACINNYAVQELNNKAMAFMQEGDYQSAIERLKSCVDLDGTIFETRYNLAIAYVEAGDYPKAIEAFEQAIKLNSEFADVYYSSAVAEENLAHALIDGDYLVDENSVYTKQVDVNKEDIVITDSVKTEIVLLLGNSINDYKTYLDKNLNANDAAAVSSKIEEITVLLAKYNSDMS
ncbi:MAG: tetratricopeptide repeat protein [Candidatus Gastranaerophilales bacterium]